MSNLGTEAYGVLSLPQIPVDAVLSANALEGILSVMRIYRQATFLLSSASIYWIGFGCNIVRLTVF